MTVPQRIADFLGAPTPREWVDAALANVPALLLDHANCELKAASTAMAFLYRYSDRAPLCQRMSRLAREELRHFEQVKAIIDDRALTFRRLSASRYAGGLNAHIRHEEPARLLDALLVGAIIEARSCERFALVAPLLPEPLGRFYAGLLAAEARHFENYLALAKSESGSSAREIDLRLAELLSAEAALVAEPDPTFRFHSGLPTR